MDDLNDERPLVASMQPAILPGDPPEPCPELLTLDEAIRYLRLDVEGGPDRPDLTLRRYRDLGLLRGIRVGRVATQTDSSKGFSVSTLHSGSQY